MSPEALAEFKPYRGPLSYEIEDADYFFGRDRDADLLAAKILSARFTLLHAQSGTGKTSLLNARIVPALESQGWTALRIIPSRNPSEEVRLGVLLGLLPPPSAERQVLDRVLARFWDGQDPTLDEILAHFDAVSRSDPRRHDCLVPVEGSLNLKSAALAWTGKLRPLLLRLLTATLEVSQYCEHLHVVAGVAAGSIGGATRASELRAVLDGSESQEGHQDILSQLYVPVPSLHAFFGNVFDTYGAYRTRFRLVLVLDQFEQLFTLFSDSLADPGRELWRLRWEFIEQLDQLYREGGALPLRYVISMRDEYIAQLDPIRRFVRDLDANAFHLSFLEKEEARASIGEPARLFHYSYSPDLYQSILQVLVREDRFVEPAPLQIVCERLWRDYRKLISSGQNGDKVLDAGALPKGGTREILDSFFYEFLDGIPEADRQMETLEILEPLVTANRTRNIVERDSVVTAPFRKSERRAELLQRLVDQRIVRIEQRLSGQFVEITHEFLIESILAKIRTVLNADPVYSRFRWAIRTLERFEDVDFRSGSGALLPRDVFDALNDRRQHIEWNEWSNELMLRTAIARGKDRETLLHWCEQYRRSQVQPDEDILSEERIRHPAVQLLSMEELAEATRRIETLSPVQVEFAFRSLISRAGEADREAIIQWTAALRKVCSSETQS
jgi:hypothetical protein